jgi:FkbH-like protein
MIESLQYPFDVATILRKKKSLKRELLLRKPSYQINIAILGGSTTSEIKNILELFLLKAGFLPDFYESEYNKFYEDAVFPNTALESFKPDVIFVHTSNINITRFPSFGEGEKEIAELLNNEIKKFQSIWKGLKKYNCLIIQNNFDLPVNRSLGNLDFYDIHGKTNFINQLNLLMAQAARESKTLFINDINYLSASMGLKQWYDRSLWHTAKYAVSFEAIPELANNITNILNASLSKNKKCLVLDLDNTCWGGVIGDEGVNGIGLGNETATGESFLYFQNYVAELKQRGIILAVCSKNDHENAKEGFTHSDSVLKFEDFTVFKANWEPKHQNIEAIAKEINIGLDSLVFIDDNAVERNIVSSQIPSVSVPDVGNDVIAFVDHIEKNGFFETVSLSKDDIERNNFYKGNENRVNEQSLFDNYGDFLLSLDMQAEIKPFSHLYVDRITQLINKTNQFNLTTRRYTVAEVEEVMTNNTYITLYGKLVDKFGDNGLIAIVVANIKGASCYIDLWLMSCRVLKRDMEFAMLDTLVEKCLAQGVTEIIGYYYKTPKNNMVADLYETFGFSLVEKEGENSVWKISLENYIVKNQFIKIDK